MYKNSKCPTKWYLRFHLGLLITSTSCIITAASSRIRRPRVGLPPPLPAGDGVVVVAVWAGWFCIVVGLLGIQRGNRQIFPVICKSQEGAVLPSNEYPDGLCLFEFEACFS